MSMFRSISTCFTKWNLREFKSSCLSSLIRLIQDLVRTLLLIVYACFLLIKSMLFCNVMCYILTPNRWVILYIVVIGQTNLASILKLFSHNF
jgi:hypothetical protein